MSASEKVKAEMERIAGKAVRKGARALGKDEWAAKGAALQARGTARRAKERAKDWLR